MVTRNHVLHSEFREAPVLRASLETAAAAEPAVECQDALGLRFSSQRSAVP